MFGTPALKAQHSVPHIYVYVPGSLAALRRSPVSHRCSPSPWACIQSLALKQWYVTMVAVWPVGALGLCQTHWRRCPRNSPRRIPQPRCCAHAVCTIGFLGLQCSLWRRWLAIACGQLLVGYWVWSAPRPFHHPGGRESDYFTLLLLPGFTFKYEAPTLLHMTPLWSQTDEPIQLQR